MNRLHVIPQPNKVIFTGGSFPLPGGSHILEHTERREDLSLGQEEYRLQVKRDGAILTAATAQGFFYGEQTLLQMERSYERRLPCLRIQDQPRFPYRAFMLDSARHFWTVPQVKQMIDAAVLFKFNTFHWHLTDDQGWRIEIDAYPELVEIGSVRRRSAFGTVIDENEYRGHYTKEDIREIVRYCEERFIEVVPEFDIPGHTSAVLAAFPELSCTGKPVEVQQTQGIFKDILCAGKEEAFTFAKTVLGEMAELFPGRYIHIGGDEAPKTRWKACPLCQERIKAEGLKNEEELQGYFTNRIAEYLATLGKTPMVWNESLKSGILNQTIIPIHWMDKKPVTDCARWVNHGGHMVNGDFFHYYTDYEYTRTPLKKTYSYDPAPRGVKPAALSGLLGVETMLWTEHVRDMGRMGYMAYPRFAAVAESGWTLPVHKDENGFKEAFRHVTPRLKELGITPASPKKWNPLKPVDWDEIGNMIVGAAQTIQRSLKK